MKSDKSNAMLTALRPLFLLVLMLWAEVALPVNDMTVHLFQDGDMVTKSYLAFCKDDDGFVWIGTDTGLLRFDGKQSDLYRNDELNPNSISDNRIQRLFCDSRGRLWVGTVNGLNYFDKQSHSFKRIKLPGLNLDGFIDNITELDDGRIIFKAAGIGLYSLRETDDDGGLAAERFATGIENESEISAIIKLRSDGMIVTCRGGQVYMLSSDGGKHLLGQLSANPNQVGLESTGDLILSSQYEVFRYNMRERSFTPLKVAGGERIKVTGMCSTEDGVTYLATTAKGLWEVREGSETVERTKSLYSPILNLETLKIGSVFKDDSGNLWMGCNHKGVAMVPSRKMPFISKKLDKICRGFDGEITSLEVVGDYILLGTTNGNLMALDLEGNLVKTIDIPGHNLITSIVADGPGTVALGVARDGIWRLSIGDFRMKKLTTIERPYPGILLSVTNDGEIIAGVSEVGVMKYDPVTDRQEWFYPGSQSQTLNTYYYAGISKTADNKIWIGGYSGLSCYDTRTGQLVPIDQTPFLNMAVHSICDGDDGNIMIATNKGLLRFDVEKGVLKKYTVLDGLADNDVRTIVRDRNGALWIGTLNGLSFLPRDDERIQSYSASLGLAEKSYVFSRALHNNASLVMGGVDGLTFFNPDSITPMSFGGTIKISGMFLNGNRVTPATIGDKAMPIIEGDEIFPKALHLSWKDKSLVLRLSTLDFRNTSRVRYEWQLSGDGETWNSTGFGENLVYLPSLDPGNYVLRLRGWEDNVCSDVSELVLNISQPWYLAGMAKVVYGLIGLFILGLLYKVIKSKREEELNEAKIKFFMDISHEIRSPITLLLSPVDSLLKQPQTPQTTAQLLTVRRNAQRVLNLADQMLDIRKIEKGKMRLVYTPTDLCGFISELVEMFRPQAADKGLTIGFRCSEKSLVAPVDRNNLDKILVNLISNAVKYTPSGGEIVVDLSLTTDSSGRECYEIKVIDTGIGLDSKLIKHLFERFYRDREHHQSAAPGFGIGLDLCTRLVELHGGKISGSNREDGVKGSVFTVILPLLSPDEIEAEASGTDTAAGGGRLPFFSAAPVQTQEAVKPGKSSTRYNVIVVDDDTELREYIRANLGNGFKVKTFANAEDAMKEISEKVPDIIVTDIRMDGMDGFELLKRVKANIATHHVPVILFSSINEATERTKGWKTGADGYIAKPFSIDELAGMITGLLSTRQKLKGKFSGIQDTHEKIVTPKVKGMNEELMNNVDRYITENLSETDLNVDKLSEYVGLSRSQLNRRLKEIVGISPSDYIRNIKLQKACELLRTTDIDISQVAYSLGFTAQSHFSTLFKRFTGMTPSEYRANEKRDFTPDE